MSNAEISSKGRLNIAGNFSQSPSKKCPYDFLLNDFYLYYKIHQVKKKELRFYKWILILSNCQNPEPDLEASVICPIKPHAPLFLFDLR